MQFRVFARGANPFDFFDEHELSSLAGAHQNIAIERSTKLEKGRGGRPSAIISTADGGFVIAGNSRTAWAIRVTSKGEVLWRYLEAFDPSLTPSGQSEFVGAAMLSDDSVLLCGRKILSNHDQVGLLIHLNAKGETLAEQDLYPNDDHQHRPQPYIGDYPTPKQTEFGTSRYSWRCPRETADPM